MTEKTKNQPQKGQTAGRSNQAKTASGNQSKGDSTARGRSKMSSKQDAGVAKAAQKQQKTNQKQPKSNQKQQKNNQQPAKSTPKQQHTQQKESKKTTNGTKVAAAGRARNPRNKGKNHLKVAFLGGVGEIGKNMTVLEYEDSILVIDAGLSFPNADDMPGIDYVIPDFTYLLQNRHKLKGIVVTHGHEDHIGAIPFVLKQLSTPIYGSALALGILQNKLKEHRVQNAKINEVEAGDVVNLGAFSVEFVRVTHSIAGAFALAITTPVGVVFHTGDFKIDHTPIDRHTIDLPRIAEIGKKGVLLMLQESTNVERNGFSMSEKNVGLSLDNVFAQNIHKRLIVATFASNVHRVQQIINCAIKYGRKVAFSGRSMINIVGIASKLKELNVPFDQVVDIDKIAKIPYDRLCIITTGTQGEPESALTRMSNSDFKTVQISDKDTVIFSSSPIPGNEKSIYAVINRLYRKGAEVIYQSLSEVHVSGHACKEELKMMFALVRPTYFVPVHGEFRHLKQHAELAQNMGINSANIVIPENGYVIEVRQSGIVHNQSIPAGSILLDGSVVSENSDIILRDRKRLAEDGFVIAMVTVARQGIDRMVTSHFITRGINIPDPVLDELKELVVSRINSTDYREGDYDEIKAVIRKAIAKTLYAKFKKEPMIVPMIIDA